jgi:hypothetical protein
METISTSANRVVVQIDVTGWAPNRVSALIALGQDAGTQPTPDRSPLAEGEPSGWTSDALLAAVAALRSGRAWAQVQVIEQAARRGGFIAREEVYAVAGYDSGRSLRGFTRPVNRVVSRLQDEGLLPEDAEDLLEPVYDDTVRGYQRARGFRVPADVCAMLTAG